MGRMATSEKTGRFPLVERTRQLIRRRLEDALRPIEYPLNIAGLLPGKMPMPLLQRADSANRRTPAGERRRP
jgi:hypothetical protein